MSLSRRIGRYIVPREPAATGVVISVDSRSARVQTAAGSVSAIIGISAAVAPGDVVSLSGGRIVGIIRTVPPAEMPDLPPS